MTIKEYANEIMDAYVSYGHSPSVKYIIDGAIELKKAEILSGNMQRSRKEFLREVYSKSPKEDKPNGFDDINIYH